jgi:hypothetical protein
MSDEVWNSIKSKVIGMYEAINVLPADCPKCGELLEPTDLGYDPQTNVRLWVTYCCKTMEKYEEKVLDDHNL